MIDKIFNENCLITIKRMIDNNFKVDLILTSPPYNLCSNSNTINPNKKDWHNKYDIYIDNLTEDEYINQSIEWFKNFDKVLIPNGVVLYNISYSSNNPSLIYKLIYKIIENTNFMIADIIIWKKDKSKTMPSTSFRTLTRICEFVFVFCRKTEYTSFNAYKKTVLIKNNIKYPDNVLNFIEAPNKDESCPLNQATYSTKLCNELFKIYAKENDIVYDPFMGSGTTAVACVKKNLHYIGSEISQKQCEYAQNRIKNINPNDSLDLDVF